LIAGLVLLLFDPLFFCFVFSCPISSSSYGWGGLANKPATPKKVTRTTCGTVSFFGGADAAVTLLLLVALVVLVLASLLFVVIIGLGFRIIFLGGGLGGISNLLAASIDDPAWAVETDSPLIVLYINDYKM